MRAPAPGGVGEHSGGWWAASEPQATRRKKSTSFWSRTSIPITSAASRRRTESGSFPTPMFTSPRPKAIFGCRRKSLLRRRRMRSRSSRVRKPSRRRTSRPVNGTRSVALSQSSTACKSSRCMVTPRDIPAMNFRQRDKKFCFGVTSSMHSESNWSIPRSPRFSTSTRLRLRRRGINCCLSSRARMFSSRRRMRHCFLPWVACARTGVGIAGCRWYLPIDGTRTAKGGLTMRNRITAFALMTQIVAPTLLIIGVVAYAQQSSDQPVISLSTMSKLDHSQAGIYRTKIGKIDVIAVSDGTVGLGLTKELVRNAKPGEVERLLARHFEKSPLDASVNAFLIKYENKLVLIDAGSSELVGPTAGKLPQSLRAAGVPPESITDIFVTHIHPDHTGGLMNGNTKVFPNATINVNKREVDYWFNKSIAATAVEPQKTFFAQVDPKVKPYMDSGQLKTFEGATEFFPGFRAEPAYGHTAGLTVYILENGGEKVMFWGDVVNIALQVDDPDISLRFDSDAAAAAATRRKLLEDAARKGYIVAPDHLPFPGLGHIRKDGHAYTWVPVEYVNNAVEK